MKKIVKAVTRDVKDRKKSLILHGVGFLYLSVLSFVVIFGLETYYQNVSGDPGTLYIAGFFTWVIGGLLIFLIIRRRKSLARFHAWVDQNGGKVKEIIEIDDSGLSHEIEGYCTSQMSWTSLSSFKERKAHLELVIAGGTFLIPKSLLSTDELLYLKSLLTRKLAGQDGGINSVTAPPSLH